MFCKSLWKLDLSDVKTDIDRVANPERHKVGSTRQALLLITDTTDLIVDLKKLHLEVVSKKMCIHRQRN